MVGVIDNFTARTPDERDHAVHGRLDHHAKLVDGPIAVRILGQRLRGSDEGIPGPTIFGKWHAIGFEHVLVVIDDQAGDVLRQAIKRSSIAKAERIEREPVVVILGDDLTAVDVWLNWGETVSAGILAELPVVGQIDIGRIAGCEVGRDLAVVVSLAGGVVDGDIDLRMVFLERLHHRRIGGFLGRVSPEGEADLARRLGISVLRHQRRQTGAQEQKRCGEKMEAHA